MNKSQTSESSIETIATEERERLHEAVGNVTKLQNENYEEILIQIFDTFLEHEATVIFKMKLIKIGLLEAVVQNKTTEDDYEYSIQ